MFQYAEATLLGVINSGTITQLSPAPTTVEYPINFDHKTTPASDARVVINPSLLDSRARRWVWRRYRPSVNNYESMYNILLNFQHKLREQAGKSPFVFLKEDISKNLDRLNLNGVVWERQADFVRVRVVDVSQHVAGEGGNVTYDSTVMEFIIDDSVWNVF